MESGRKAHPVVVRVECYSGWKADQRPLRFQLGDEVLLVEEIVDRWYGPDETFYKLLADDGNLYILRHHHASGEWELRSFRRAG